MRTVTMVLVALWMTADVLAASVDVRVLQDVDYIESSDYEDNKDKLDLYLPEGVEGFPVVVFFHGGGLRAGKKEGSANVGRALASAGIAAAIANYRLSPTVSHPFHARDAAAAVAWVHRNIADFGGDNKRLYLSGHSAGAYLSGLLATDGRYLEAQGLAPAGLGGVMPISGFFYVDEVAPERPKDVWGDDEEQWLEASPSRYVGARAPRLLLLYADGDDPWRRKQNEDWAAALKTKGHEAVATREIKNRDHRGIHAQIAPGDETLKVMVDFIMNP